MQLIRHIEFAEIAMKEVGTSKSMNRDSLQSFGRIHRQFF